MENRQRDPFADEQPFTSSVDCFAHQAIAACRSHLADDESENRNDHQCQEAIDQQGPLYGASATLQIAWQPESGMHIGGVLASSSLLCLHLTELQLKMAEAMFRRGH